MRREAGRGREPSLRALFTSAGLLAIRRRDAVVLCFDRSTDPDAIAAGLARLKQRHPVLRCELDRCARRVRVHLSDRRSTRLVEEGLRSIRGKVPVVEMP